MKLTSLFKSVLRSPTIVARRGPELIYSAIFLSPLSMDLRTWRLRNLSAPAGLRTALVAHVYYPELLDEILAIFDLLPPGSRLLITAPPDKAAALRPIVERRDDVELHETINRGRDIAPFMKLLTEGHLDRFDAVLKIHSKKSPHLSYGGVRRRIFFIGLAGSAGNVARILRLFSDRKVGFVGLGWYFRIQKFYWMTNRQRVEQLCERIGATPAVGFFEGSMFWCRPAALQPLKRLALQAEDFEAEAGQLDGTLHHAIERCFVLAGEAAGYETRSLSGRRLTPR